MPSKATNPVVQIVDGDEEDVGRLILGKDRANQQQKAKKCEDGFHLVCSVTVYFFQLLIVMDVFENL